MDTATDLKKENFALSANQCHHGYSTEGGDHRCKYQDRIAELEKANADLRLTLAIFAAIKPSSFFPADGSENEGYAVYVYSADMKAVSFTGKDLARARELTK